MAIRYVVRHARRVERTTARREARGDAEINTRMFDVLQVDDRLWFTNSFVMRFKKSHPTPPGGAGGRDRHPRVRGNTLPP